MTMTNCQSRSRSMLLLSLTFAFACAESNGRAEDAAPSFPKQIAPLLQKRCVGCHGGDTPKGDLDLTSRQGMLTGGAAGPAIEPGKSTESLLFEYVREKQMPPKEPLLETEVALLRRWIDAGAHWEGAALTAPTSGEQKRAGKDFWSIQPIRRPPVPHVSDPQWSHNPIDAFIEARRQKEGLQPASSADRRTLLRRVSFDLTGLPPTPEEMEAFVNDPSESAYETVVDRLLASPRYGERWGRHWLDVVRFAESHGYETNALRPNAWRYRDYVIRAFNRDTPFPQFVLEQLAGDAVAKGDPLTDAATGFIVGGTHDIVGNQSIEGKLQQRQDDLYDMVSATGSTFLGLTINCARCHDHKFDPISQNDFYSMEAVFSGVQHGERPIVDPNAEENKRLADKIRGELASLDLQVDALEPMAGDKQSGKRRPAVSPRRNVERFAPIVAKGVRLTIERTVRNDNPCIDELEIFSAEPAPRNLALASLGSKATASSEFPGLDIHKIVHLNDGLVGNSHSWISNEAGKGWVTIELAEPATIDRVVWGRDREEKYLDRLASEYVIETSADLKIWTPVAGSWDRAEWGTKPDSKEVASDPDASRKALSEQRQALTKKLEELTKPPMIYAGTFTPAEPMHILKRGDPLQKLEEVGPSAVSAIGSPLKASRDTPEQRRRIALAEWIADPVNPLPARVMVNRVWHYHFGQGLVRTPSDFGFNGDRPSHPELLDWLAAEYQSNGWKLKPLHRLMVLSATYRQSSRPDSKGQAVDAGNRLLWRFSPRRLEAEAIRDTMLSVSGSLDLTMGGPGYDLWDYTGYVIVFKPKEKLGPAEFRRMVYQFKPRTQQDGTFGAFDCPDATLPSPRRNASTTALQALNLLNSPFVMDQSERFAKRLESEAGTELQEQVRRAFLLAFGRAPTEKELEGAVELSEREGMATLCRVLFNANEFVFVH